MKCYVESINHQKGFLMGKRLIKEMTESSLNLIKSLSEKLT